MDEIEAVVVPFEEIFSIPYEHSTPEWNIKHYTKLLKYTKHSVRRKKLQQELDWWLEAKRYREYCKNITGPRE